MENLIATLRTVPMSVSVSVPNSDFWTYEEAKEKVEDAIMGRKKIDRYSYLEKTQDGFGVKLDQTYVVEILPEDQYRLNTGGMKTSTVRNYINDFSPAGISLEQGKWRLKDGSVFRDGIVVNFSGDVVQAKSLTPVASIRR